MKNKSPPRGRSKHPVMETFFKAITKSHAPATLDFEWKEDDTAGSAESRSTGIVALATTSKSSSVKDSACPFCDAVDTVDTTPFLTCRTCGYVIQRTFDTTAEYRYFAQEDRGGDPTRVGAPQDAHLPQASLSTVILGGYRNTKAMYGVRKYHTWNTMPYKERALIQTYERLSLIGLNFGINQSVIEATKALYITLQEVGGRQGLSRDAMLSACLYMALKESGSPRKAKEIADIFGLSSATFTKALKQMQEVFALGRQKGKITAAKAGAGASTRATEYIQLPLSRLPIQRAQQEMIGTLAARIAEKVETDGLSQENMPPSLAAGCLAFVLKRSEAIDIPLSKIAEAAEISAATLQKCLRRLEAHAEVLEGVIGA